MQTILCKLQLQFYKWFLYFDSTSEQNRQNEQKSAPSYFDTCTESFLQYFFLHFIFEWEQKHWRDPLKCIRTKGHNPLSHELLLTSKTHTDDFLERILQCHILNYMYDGSKRMDWIWKIHWTCAQGILLVTFWRVAILIMFVCAFQGKAVFTDGNRKMKGTKRLGENIGVYWDNVYLNLHSSFERPPNMFKILSICSFIRLLQIAPYTNHTKMRIQRLWVLVLKYQPQTATCSWGHRIKWLAKVLLI